MKSQFAIFLLTLGMTVLAEDVQPKGQQIEFACDRAHVAAMPTTKMAGRSILNYTRIPGAGRSLSRLSIQNNEPYIFQIEGTVIDDNVGFTTADADIYVGNLDVTNVLSHYGTSQTNGRFSIRVSIQTLADRKQALPTNACIVIDPASNYASATHESLKRELRYLYVGRDGVDLYQYELPYEKVERAAGDYHLEDKAKSQR